MCKDTALQSAFQGVTECSHGNTGKYGRRFCKKAKKMKRKMSRSSAVDTEARRQAAQVFRRFINGQITNEEFENNKPATADSGVHAIWDTAWAFYDDIREHKLEGRYALTRDQKRACVRWLLFLQTDHPYMWPAIRLPGLDPEPRVEPKSWLRAIKVFSVSPARAESFFEAGHYAAWPFLSTADYKAALRSPKFLAGRSGGS